LEILKTIFKVVGLPILGLIISRAFLEFAHANGWYPELHLARLMMASTDVWHVGWARWGIIAVITVALWATGYWFFFVRTKPTKRASIPPTPPVPDATPSLLCLSVGEDHAFIDYPNYTPYSLTRRYSVRLDNISPDKSVSDCKVIVTAIQPESGFRLPRLLKEGFALAAGDHTFIRLVSYGEAREPSKFNCADSVVVVWGSARETALQFEKPNAFTIRATALGSPFTELTCYAWVDPNGKLRISDAPPAEDHVGRVIERDVYLSDAIKRAHSGRWLRSGRDFNGLGIALDAAERLSKLVADVRQLALDGKLPLWGKRAASDVWEVVPKEFWESNQLNYLTAIHEDPLALQVIDIVFTGQRNDEWRELMTSWQAVETLWPRGGKA